MIVNIADTETSGLIENGTRPLDKQPECIELFISQVDLSTGEVIGEFESLFKPRKPIEDLITKITGITNEMLADAPAFGDKVDSWLPNLIKAPFIAHNASFDKEMLDIEMRRLGRIIEWPRVICSVEQTIHLRGYRLSLQALHEHLFGEPFKEAHRAKTDVQALTRCCVELFKRGEL